MSFDTLEAAFDRQVQLQEKMWQHGAEPNPNPNPNPNANQVQLQEKLWQHGAAAKAAAKWRAPHEMRLTRSRPELRLESNLTKPSPHTYLNHTPNPHP